MSDLSDTNAAQSVKIIGADSSGVEQTPVQSTADGAVHANLRSSAGIEIGTASDPIVIEPLSELYSSYSPDPKSVPLSSGVQSLDASGRLETHSSVLVDEGSFRDDFIGSSLNTTLTGSVVFTNNSIDVSGSGTLFTTEIRAGQYIKKTADSETEWVRVSYVVSDTALVLEDVYTGTTATTTGHISNWKTISGPGSTSVASSLVTINSGTAIGTTTLYRVADYGPFSATFRFAISQRIANQTITIGFRNDISAPTISAEFQFTGTTANIVNCISTSSSNLISDLEQTTVTMNTGVSSFFAQSYTINITNESVTFLINSVIVAKHTLHIPGAYDPMYAVMQIAQTAIVTNTTITCNFYNLYNVNRVEIINRFEGDQLVIAPVQLTEKVVATYSASSAPFVAASTPTDVFTIFGSSTKIIRVKRIYIALTATASTIINVLLIKRSTANTGGTSTAITMVPHDSYDLAATASVLNYTANPSLGSTVGTIRSLKVLASLVATVTASDHNSELCFGNNGDKSIVLRGTGQCLSINLNSVTIAGNSICAYVEWTEETL